MVFIIILASCAPTEEPKLRPVTTKESDQPLRSEPSEYTITVEGKVTDKVNGEEIHNARVIVITIAGTYTFEGNTFEVSFPAMSVVNIRAEAAGYEPFMQQLKAHYERSATINIEIRLDRVGPLEVTPKSIWRLRTPLCLVRACPAGKDYYETLGFQSPLGVPFMALMAGEKMIGFEIRRSDVSC